MELVGAYSSNGIYIVFLSAAGSEGDDSEGEDVSEEEVDDGDEVEEDEEEGEGEGEEGEGAGMEMLVSGKAVTEEGFSGVAAAAEQFQPKGITLATTEVCNMVYMYVVPSFPPSSLLPPSPGEN